jgi:GNAT superfamily N-acetyltransferase
MPFRWYSQATLPDNLRATKSLFDSPQWARAVALLGARCWSGIDDASARRLSLFVWTKWPLRVGFFGFPVSPVWLNGDILASIQADGLPERIDLIRTNYCMLDSPPHHDQAIALPESAIVDLVRGPQRHARRNRKDLALALRHQVALRDAVLADAPVIFRIYAQTIERHAGRMRYNLEYFSALLDLSTRNPNIQVRMAIHADRSIGYCVAVKEGERGYYLHAGVDADSRQLGAADVLVNDAIEWARSSGCTAFSLMPSPVNQPGLSKFKQKWGDQDGQWLTVDHANGLLGKMTSTLMRLRR